MVRAKGGALLVMIASAWRRLRRGKEREREVKDKVLLYVGEVSKTRISVQRREEVESDQEMYRVSLEIVNTLGL